LKRILSTAVVLAVVFTLGLVGASCATSTQVPIGTIEVRVTDAPPGAEVTSIMVQVSEVVIHKAVAEQEQESEQEEEQQQEQEQEQEQEQQQQEELGEWIPIQITGPNPFDLLQIRGLEEVLATDEVEAGKYTQIRMTIDSIQVILGDGDPQEATVPSGKLKFVRPFNVEEGETTVLLLDFDADKSVVVTGSGKVMVKPVVKLIVQQGKPHELASIEGVISGVNIEASTITITPADETGAVVLDVTDETNITLDGFDASLSDLAALVGQENSATVTYYVDSLEAVQITAQSQPQAP